MEILKLNLFNNEIKHQIPSPNERKRTNVYQKKKKKQKNI